MNIGNGLKAVMLGLVLVLPSGCSTLEATEARALIKIKAGVIEVEGEIKFKKKETEEKSSLALGEAASQTQLNLTSTNATIPNQRTLATLVLKNSSDQVVGARTFIVDIYYGVAKFANPADVETWFSSMPVSQYGSVVVTAPDVEIYPGRTGTYTATNTIVLGGHAIASATASRTSQSPGPVMIEQ